MLPWFEFLPQNAHFPVKGRSIKSQLSSVPAVQRAVKKAVVEALQAHYSDEHGDEHSADLPDDPERGPTCVIEAALRDNEVVLTLDTSGVGLHKRGYRELTGKAPLRETMAAALVMLSHWRADRPLMDPFCGTGTILIEAAMIGRNIAPGLERTFDCEDWPCIGREAFVTARAEARAAIRPSLEARLIGTDIDEEALSYARHHSRKAGVADDIHYQHRAFGDLAAKFPYGCIITNPPYGERLEDVGVHDLHRAMPVVLSRLETWSHFILTAYPEFEQVIGQPANRRRKLYNAQIECTYYQFWGPKPPSIEREREEKVDRAIQADRQADPLPDSQQAAVDPGPNADAPALIEPNDTAPAIKPRPDRAFAEPAGPVFGGLDDHVEAQAEAFANRLAKNDRHLRKWPAKGVHCFRLYERDIPEVPLVVDRYHDCLHIAEYERPNDRTIAQHAQWMDRMAQAAAEATGTDPAKVYQKTRLRQRGDTQHQRQDDAGHIYVVEEGGLQFKVNLSDYIDTGLFLDHRNARQMVRDRADDKRVLNLFGYTGSFSVYAAAGGARSTTTVDLSNTYLAWAQDNFELNELDPFGSQHEFIREDAMAFVAAHPRPAGGAYDLAIVDPPTFSNSKRLDDVFDIQRDHVDLLQGVAELMSPGGLVYFSSNNRRFKLDEAALMDDHNGYAKIHDISKQTVPEDYRNKRIHRCWAMVKKS